MRGLTDWSDTLIGSEALAGGIVNSLWELVHGQPLRGSVVDPFAAPYDEALDKLYANLVEDLRRSGFDVGRTLALILGSSAAKRQVPASLKPENAFVSDRSRVDDARNSVHAFAAAMPHRQSLSIDRRLDQAKRAIGASLDQNGRPFVAQLGSPVGTMRPKVEAGRNALADDFPSPSETLPVQWLRRIEDLDRQVEHVAFLAGMSDVPDSVLGVARRMQAADGDGTALHRVWWMVRP